MFRVNSYWAHLTITHCHTKFLERKIRYDTIRYKSLTWTRKLSIPLYLAHVARKNVKNKIKQTNASAIVEAFSPSDLQYCAMTSDIKLLIRRNVNTFSVFESLSSFVCICLFMFRQVMLYVYMQLNSVAEYFGCI